MKIKRERFVLGNRVFETTKQDTKLTPIESLINDSEMTLESNVPVKKKKKGYFASWLNE